MSTDPSDPAVDPAREARVRRVPRYALFLALGAALGIIAALVFTYAFDGTSERSPFTELKYSQGQVFGFLLLFCIPIGIALGGVVALVLDRTLRRRSRQVRVIHEHIHVVDD
ncbi:potassium transporter Trk [Microbacterium sp.]|uniref:potassium transporter Trk n=1 Tax=Microbacterium sp. TaxID=51671 RepID=UPI003A86D08A